MIKEFTIKLNNTYYWFAVKFGFFNIKVISVSEFKQKQRETFLKATKYEIEYLAYPLKDYLLFYRSELRDKLKKFFKD